MCFFVFLACVFFVETELTEFGVCERDKNSEGESVLLYCVLNCGLKISSCVAAVQAPIAWLGEAQALKRFLGGQ